MALTGKLTSLFSDKAKTKPIFPFTKTKAVSNDDGVILDTLLNKMSYDINYLKENQGTGTGGDGIKHFVATPEKTTFQEILDAYNAGRLIFVEFGTDDGDKQLGQLAMISESYCAFIINAGVTVITCVVAADNSWQINDLWVAEEVHTHGAEDITDGTLSSEVLPTASSTALGGVKIGKNINISNGAISVPEADGTVAGVTVVYPAASCTTFTSDKGTVTPLAVQKAAKQFAITRPSATIVNAIARYINNTGDVQNSKITIEDVTNTKDSSKKAQVLVIPAEGGKKMVYGYCTDQVDGTSFIGGVFDAGDTLYPYNKGLAIGGTSGNLLWKGKRILDANDLTDLNSAINGKLSISGTAAKATADANGKNIADTYATKTEAENKLSISQGVANTGKIPMVDANGNLTLTDVEEIGSTTTTNKLADFIQNTDIDYAYDSATGANYTIIRVYKNRIDGTKQYPFVYAPKGINTGIYTTYDLVSAENWLLAINAGVFDTSNTTPDGLLIQNGNILQSGATTTHSQCKPLTIDNNGNLGYAEYNANAEQLINNGVISAVTGFIPIIVDYQPVPSSSWNNVSHYTENAQRQIIGQFGNGDYAIITCEGRSFDNSDGWTLAEAQTICQKHGLKFAYNLDGGGSTETMLGHKHINTIYEGTTGRKVPTFIVFNGTTVFDKETPQGRLPEGYTELSYLTPPAGAYFDTGIPATADYDFEAKFQAGSPHLLSNANYYYPTFTLIGENRVLRYMRFGKESQTAFTYSFNNDYTVKAVGDTLSIDGTVVSTTASKGTTTPTGTLYMFCYGGAPTTDKYQWANNRFYYLKLFDKTTGAILYDYIPCRNPSGVVGLYEAVHKKFYGSDTSVAFTGV